MHCPHYNPAGTVSPGIYRPYLEEAADPLSGNRARTRTPNSDHRLVVYRPPAGSPFSRLSSRPQSGPLVTAAGEPALADIPEGNLWPCWRNAGYCHGRDTPAYTQSNATRGERAGR